jgi:hypothetical protein
VSGKSRPHGTRTLGNAELRGGNLEVDFRFLFA